MSDIWEFYTFSVDDYNNDVILKHEKTRKVKEDDRTNHIVTTNAQTGAVFLTYKGLEEIDSLVNEYISTNEPEYDFTADDGIIHKLWILPDTYNEQLSNLFLRIDKLYIADGHHRAASAARAQKVLEGQNKEHTGKEEYNYFLAVIFPAEQLKILPYNRVVFSLNGNDKEEFIKKIDVNFNVEKTNTPVPERQREIKMYMDNVWINWHLMKM